MKPKHLKLIEQMLASEVESAKVRLQSAKAWSEMKPTRTYPKSACLKISERAKRIAIKNQSRADALEAILAENASLSALELDKERLDWIEENSSSPSGDARKGAQ